MNRALATAALLVAALAGCSETVEGQAVKPSASAVAASARTFAQVLPDEPAMSEALGPPIQNPYPRPSGGLSVLPDGTGGATPTDCVILRTAAMRQGFEGAPAKSPIARATRNIAFSPLRTSGTDPSQHPRARYTAGA